MADMMDHQDGKRRTCVIGAGVSGLVAAKVFSARGRDVTVLEQGAALGGVWAPEKSYPGVKTQTPRDLYSFTDFPMPKSYPEWPSGEQVAAYLDAYAQNFALRHLIRFGVSVTELARGEGGAGWRVTVIDQNGKRTEFYDEVLVCTGQFSRPKSLDLPGAEMFAEGGGKILHSSEYHDDRMAAGRDVVILGYAKSATDIAMQALAAKARSVTMVVREPAWKIPYFFGNVLNFKNILYCRASEAMFMPWAPSTLGRLGRALCAPLIWANWRALESLLERQFKLTKLGLRPAGRIEDSIHCATSIETPGFYKAIARGAIRVARGTLAAASPGHVVTSGGESLKADLVVLAIGWEQDLPFLDAQTRAALIDPDGQFLLHRMIVNPGLPDLAFIGFNSSFITTLSAELSAHWAVRWFDKALARMPTQRQMYDDIARVATWKQATRPVARGFGGLCVAPYHFAHFDELMADMGARRRPGNPIAANLLPINPRTYADLLATAPAFQQETIR